MHNVEEGEEKNYQKLIKKRRNPRKKINKTEINARRKRRRTNEEKRERRGEQKKIKKKTTLLEWDKDLSLISGAIGSTFPFNRLT